MGWVASRGYLVSMERPMSHTPPPLKWLSERRARLAGQLQKQTRALQAGQARSAKLLEDISRLHTSIAELCVDLQALDSTIGLYDSRVRPSSIEPVGAWQGKYGERGALKRFLAQELKRDAGAWLSTSCLAALACERFSLSFDTELAYRRWLKGSVGGALRMLANQGLAERGHDPSTVDRGRWRWKQPVELTLADLRAAAGATPTSIPTPP